MKLQNPIKILKRYALTLFYNFDPLLNAHSVLNFEKHNTNRPFETLYLFPLLILITTYLYGNVYIAYSVTGKWLNSRKEIISCPHLMYHLILPQETWPQSDMAYSLSCLLSIVMYFTFLFKPNTAVPRYEVKSAKNVTKASKEEDANSVVLTVSGKSKKLKNIKKPFFNFSVLL